MKKSESMRSGKSEHTLTIKRRKRRKKYFPSKFMSAYAAREC